MSSLPGSRAAQRHPLGVTRVTRTTQEERTGQPPHRKLRIGEMPGITHEEEESRGEVATEAAEVATEDVEDEDGKVPAVADTVADPTKKIESAVSNRNLYSAP